MSAPEHLPLRAVILDRIVQWRMEMMNGPDYIQEEWLDPETDMLHQGRLPDHLLGQYDQMVRNALPLADSIIGHIHGRLQ